MNIYFSEIAKFRFKKLTDYLLENWNLQVKNDFLKKFDLKISQIKTHPYNCIESFEYKGLYKCVITKQTTLFYRVSEKLQEIEIITIFDTKQNPNKLYKDL
ncbi:type II toxin-antitoxin system RelE/ParE family toxin [Polaribacter cellanae]|uniref:Type II toxin-antitoxin system RelE/ParE family toxin n=1 Tax=Polaribacter cellanae TaxID=2818493 RepID=A0A975CQ07_9FLAO|nr:type II toxin-antitoxin system RelE/ParE family toxin [Polaribacter cellanae]QTE23230.1 type II toxin-antitoxin system RelE/ParE family toxin [Polaribacter cellanae]